MKYFIYLMFLALFITSCSESTNNIDTDDDNGQELTSQNIDIKLNIKQNTGNIFQLLEFSLYSEKGFTLLDSRNTYDSLVWTIPNLGRFHIFNRSSFTFAWSQNFFLPGKYTSILQGYKDNKSIKADTAYITIRNDKDFLGYNWKDITKPLGYSNGYADILAKDYTFATYQSIKDSIPSITLFLLNEGKDDEKTFSQKSEKILSDYINTLYSEPTYTEKQNELLTKEYNKLFNNRIEGAKPIYIWITPKSKIVLYSYYEEYGGYNEYRIQAEPR